MSIYDLNMRSLSGVRIDVFILLLSNFLKFFWLREEFSKIGHVVGVRERLLGVCACVCVCCDLKNVLNFCII